MSTINRTHYLNKSTVAQRSEIPDCVCTPCEEKRKDAGHGWGGKEELELTRRLRRYEGRRNQCGTCFTAKSANGSCMCE